MKLSEAEVVSYDVYHGYSKEVVEFDKLKMPIHFAFDSEASDPYSLNAGSKQVDKFKVSLNHPLIFNTSQEIEELWVEAGILEKDRDVDWCATRRDLSKFNTWVKSKGYDGIVVTKKSFDGRNVPFDTFGEPQVIAFKHSSLEKTEINL